jgi:hypothetical protein
MGMPMSGGSGRLAEIDRSLGLQDCRRRHVVSQAAVAGDRSARRGPSAVFRHRHPRASRGRVFTRQDADAAGAHEAAGGIDRSVVTAINRG